MKTFISVLLFLGFSSAHAVYVPYEITSGVDKQRAEAISFGGPSEISQCVTSPCTIYRQSGSWVTSVTRVSMGIYTLHIAAGVFSAPPVCVFMDIYSNGRAFSGNSFVPTSTSVQVAGFTTVGGLLDIAGNVICRGPR